jgi:hypothetical protein
VARLQKLSRFTRLMAANNSVSLSFVKSGLSPGQILLNTQKSHMKATRR